MNNNIFAFVLLVSSLIPLASFANDDTTQDAIPGEITGSVAITSDYIFRGISQTDREPAAQASIDYNVNINEQTKLYLGVWGTNVNFSDDNESDAEFDWYGGVNYTIDDLTLDAGVIYYSYPGSDDNLNYNFIEGKLAATYNFTVATVGASVNYSPEYFGDTGASQYYKLNFEVPTPAQINLTGHIAYLNVEDSENYNDWSLGASYMLKGLKLRLEYIDTNENTSGDLSDSKAVFTASKTF